MAKGMRLTVWCHDNFMGLLTSVGIVCIIILCVASGRNRTVVIDSCEYIRYGDQLIHKGNCTNSFHLK